MVDTVVTHRWPDVEAVPHAPARAAAVAALLPRIAKRVPFGIARDDSPAGAPVLRLRRPGHFYRRVGATGLIGLGEAYQAGDWDSDDLAGLLTATAVAMRSDRLGALRGLGRARHSGWARSLFGAVAPENEQNTVDGARRNIARHYDLSNDFFALFLDETMTYSSALFADADDEDLAGAQRRKVDRLLDRTGVGAGTRVLEIGTGWGELAMRAAWRGATVHTITISVAQHALATRRVREAGLDDRVTVELRDYRDVSSAEGYDAILSVEMIEAVGDRFWPDYFGALDRLLAPGGRVGLQAITVPDDKVQRAAHTTYTWITKYIFPGGVMLSVEEAERQLARTSLRIAGRQAFGRDYATTLRLWRERFLAASGEVGALGFDEIFRRTWEYYLAYCEAGFRSGEIDVYQLILDRAED